MDWDWKEIGKSIVSLGLPVLGTALTGPSGGIVGALVAQKLGVDPTPEAVAQAVKTDPAAATKLLELQNNHQEEMERLANDKRRIDLEGDRAYLGDRADARARDEALISAGKGNQRANYMILGDVVGLIVCAVGAIFGDRLGISEPGRMFLATVASYFGLGLRDAHAFEFGSSRGSREKDEAIRDMVPISKLNQLPAAK